MTTECGERHRLSIGRFYSANLSIMLRLDSKGAEQRQVKQGFLVIAEPDR